MKKNIDKYCEIAGIIEKFHDFIGSFLSFFVSYVCLLVLKDSYLSFLFPGQYQREIMFLHFIPITPILMSFYFLRKVFIKADTKKYCPNIHCRTCSKEFEKIPFKKSILGSNNIIGIPDDSTENTDDNFDIDGFD